jgi:acetyl esterase/lipase
MAFPRVLATVNPSGGLSYSGICFSELRGFRPLLLDLHVPPVSGDMLPPLVVYIHGGGFVSGDRRYLADNMQQGSIFEAMNAAGIACATIDYRLAGEAPFPAPIEDTAAAIDFLRAHDADYGVDASRLGTWGESAGGLLAVVAGLTDPRVAAVVSWYTPSDLRPEDLAGDGDEWGQMVFGGPLSKATAEIEAASAVTLVGPSAPPILHVHGDADDEVPAVHSERLHELLIAAGTRSTYRSVPGAGHCFRGYADVIGLIDESVAFLDAEL